MNKLYSPRFYPNPFRYRKLKNKLETTQILEEINDQLKPFLADKFNVVQDYFDEFGNPKSEIKIIRILRNKIKFSFDVLKTKILLADTENSLENYYKNLRYLEFPVQPFTDSKGFEVQLLSNDILEDTIEEIEEGFSYIYEYCSKMFPESTELWTEYALLTPGEFPYISHDSILESSYEIFDKIFDNLQKSSVNLFSWIISGDLNTRLLKVIKPKFGLTKMNYLFIILESMLSITLLLIITKYLLSNSKSVLILKDKKINFNNLHCFFSELKQDFNFKRFKLKQKNKKLKEKVLNFKTTFKYQVIKTVLG